MTTWLGRFVSRPGAVCPGFWRLRYIAACPHGCAYCYLRGVYWRGRPRAATVADLPDIARAVSAWMVRTTEPAVLNAGELSDSFAPGICAQVSLHLAHMFARQERHTLLLVTKALPVALLDLPPTPRVIVSISLGQQVFGGQRLGSGPDAAALALAATRLAVAGWRVRLRLDPLIDRDGVGQVVDLLGRAAPQWERLTLGSLRFTTAGYRAARRGGPVQRALAACVGREEGGAGTHPYRLPLAQRTDLYAAVLSSLGGQAQAAALCKETPAAWHRVFGGVPETVPCNCTA